MLQIANHTPFKCTMGLFPNEEGVDCIYGVVKGTFQVGVKGVSLAGQQSSLILADEFWDVPGKSSLRHAAEVGLSKPATDVLLQGHAYAPGGQATATEVQLRVDELQKTVCVFGNRYWESGLLGLKITPPEPFQKIPLRYEHAFGGTDPQPEDVSKVDYEPRNPVGKGLVPKKSQALPKGTPLPNLEDPRELVRSPKDRPTPACFGPVCAQWEPRRSYAGTYDQTWLRKRAPYLPSDFNPRFLQVASPDLIAAGYLKGGESVEILGASADGPLRFHLPQCTVEMVFHFDGQPCKPAVNLDTVCIEPDQQRCCLLWRACQVVDKRPHRLRELEVHCREFPNAAGRG